MTSVVNLNRFRKAKERAEKARRAAENRAASGRGKAERRETDAERRRRERDLDGKRIEQGSARGDAEGAVGGERPVVEADEDDPRR
jgi:hypothetical protein